MTSHLINVTDKIWTCQKQSKGVKCGHRNPKRKLICGKCGKKRTATKKPAHMVALDIPYEEYIELNGGEHCGVCGRKPNGRRLDRDHWHTGPHAGKPRGLLCSRCNRDLVYRLDVEWLENAINYLKRSMQRYAIISVD